ncbi:hypothetical protein ACOSP7_003860 [Xanthoceras sorbifolium]
MAKAHKNAFNLSIQHEGMEGEINSKASGGNGVASGMVSNEGKMNWAKDNGTATAANLPNTQQENGG